MCEALFGWTVRHVRHDALLGVYGCWLETPGHLVLNVTVVQFVDSVSMVVENGEQLVLLRFSCIENNFHALADASLHYYHGKTIIPLHSGYLHSTSSSPL